MRVSICMGMRVSPVLPTLSVAVPIKSSLVSVCKASSLCVVALQKDNIAIDLVHHVGSYIAHFKVE